MRRKTVAFITVVGSLVVAACTSDRETTAPRSIAPAQARADVITTWPACDPTGLKAASRNFFALKSDQKMVGDFTLNPTATGALNILSREADVRYTPNQVAPWSSSFGAGGTVATQVAVCGGLVSAALGYPTNFDPTAALQSGIFAVMGASPTTTSSFVLAYNSARSIPSDLDYYNVYKGAASPIWGVEGAWPIGVQLATAPASETRYLVYAYPTTSTVPTAFELGTVPASVDVAPRFASMTVAECVSPTVSPNTANVFGHQHDATSSTTYLALRGASFCNGHIYTAAASSLEMLGRRLAALLSPKPAYAQFSFSGTGGGDGSWGSWSIDQFTGSTISLAFGPLPASTTTGTWQTVQVQATQHSTDPLPPINVRLTIVGNLGSPTAFYYCDANGCYTSDHVDAFTDATGLATFRFQFTKAGGTDLHADGYVGGGTVQTLSVTAPQIQVQNK